MYNITEEELDRAHGNLLEVLNDLRMEAANKDQVDRKEFGRRCLSLLSIACKILVIILTGQNSDSLLDGAIKNWIKIYDLFKECTQDMNVPMPEFTHELFLASKEGSIAGLHLMIQCLDESIKVLGGELAKQRFNEVKQRVTGREWASGLSKEQILPAIKIRIKSCEDFIEELISNPKEALRKFNLVGQSLDLDIPLVNSVTDSAFIKWRQCSIRVSDDVIQELRAWQKELEG